jgi:hypothetical protein
MSPKPTIRHLINLDVVVRVGHDVTSRSVAYVQVNGHGIAGIAMLMGIATFRLAARAHTETQRHRTGTGHQDGRALENAHKFILMRMGMAQRRGRGREPWNAGNSASG